jgi:signal peptidase I
LWQRILIGIAGVVGGLVVLGFVLFLFVLKGYRAPSESMIPTIEVNDRFLVNRLAGADVGEVVVFHPPTGAMGEGAKCGRSVTESELCPEPGGERAEVQFVKRVVARPGDRLRITNGRVILNGKRVDEPYAKDCVSEFGCNFDGEITVPEGHWYMLGDNRDASDDSRFWGPVPEDWIKGQAIFKYWPPGSLGGI